MHMALRLSVHKGKLIVILINDNIYHLSHDLSPVHKLMPITYITSKTLCTTLSEFKRWNWTHFCFHKNHFHTWVARKDLNKTSSDCVEYVEVVPWDGTFSASLSIIWERKLSKKVFSFSRNDWRGGIKPPGLGWKIASLKGSSGSSSSDAPHTPRFWWWGWKTGDAWMGLF